MSLITLSQRLEDMVIDLYHKLHACAEVRYQTTKTRELILKSINNTLNTYNIPPHIYRIAQPSEGGIWIAMQFNDDPLAKSILLRADMDALPMEEKTGLSYSSQNPGVMHACGHDSHTAMLLVAFEAACSAYTTRHKLNNAVFLWQDAEENPGAPPQPKSGAQLLLEDEYFQEVFQQVTAVYALHVMPNSESGVFQSLDGQMLGNSDRFTFTVKASGGHVGLPHLSQSAEFIGRQVCNRLDTFNSRNLAPTEIATLAISGILTGGQLKTIFGITTWNGQATSNILPATAEYWGSFRTFRSGDARHASHDLLEKEIRKIVKSYDAEVEFRMVLGHTATINTNWTEVKSTLDDYGFQTAEFEPLSGGEDFGLFLEQKPGCMVMLGAGAKGQPGPHKPDMKINEEVLQLGVMFWLVLLQS